MPNPDVTEVQHDAARRENDPAISRPVEIGTTGVGKSTEKNSWVIRCNEAVRLINLERRARFGTKDFHAL
jgi:hypothetical protein